MANTKIINVQKGDSFDEVFDAFKNTSAEDVIFIFPKGSRVAKKEKHFELLSAQAQKFDKTVSIMSADSVVVSLAAAHGLQILGDNKPKPKAKLAASQEPE
jgi:hypothetical protein